MIDAGLPLVQCLEILGNQEEDANFAATILQTRADVENGQSLADAMRKHPKTFDALFTNMVAAGEAGGILDTILKRLATYIEKNVKLKGQVKSAMVYPIAVIVIAGLVVGVDPVEGHPDVRRDVRRPRRRAAAADARRHRAQRRPRALRMDRHRRAWRARSAGRSSSTTRTESGRRVVDGMVLKLPILGLIMRKIAVARFCRTLSTLISSGVPDSRRARHHGAHLGQRHRRGRDSVHAQEHRGRQHDRGAAEGDRRLPGDGRADDRRRRGDRRARHDAEQDRRLLRRGSRHGRRRPADAARAGDDRVPRRASSAASSSRCTCRSST